MPFLPFPVSDIGIPCLRFRVSPIARNDKVAYQELIKFPLAMICCTAISFRIAMMRNGVSKLPIFWADLKTPDHGFYDNHDIIALP